MKKDCINQTIIKQTIEITVSIRNQNMCLTYSYKHVGEHKSYNRAIFEECKNPGFDYFKRQVWSFKNTNYIGGCSSTDIA